MKMLSIVAIAFAFTALMIAAEDAPKPLGTPFQTAGKVTSMHCCAMSGMSDTHTVVKLETAEGKTDIVDLGPTAELKNKGIEPKEGEKYTVEGKIGKINDTFLIVAEKMTEPKSMAMSHMGDMKDCCKVEGPILSTLKMKMDGEPGEHYISKIQSDKGIAVVDLGLCSELPDTVKVTEGQNLAITGFVGELNGKPIIMADSCGNLCHIKRAPTTEAK